MENLKVEITKLNAGDKTIGELVAADYRKAEVFRDFGMDYCCGGHKTVQQVCAKKGLNAAAVEAALETVEKSPKSKQQDFNNWELAFLTDYIMNTHHKYVKNSIPMIIELSEKVASRHGDTHPETIEIAKYTKAVVKELLMHMPKEEKVLFPYIKQMVNAQRSGTTMTRPGFGTIENPIRMMESEHVSAGSSMEKVKTLSNNYTPPPEACASYRVLYSKLQEFEQDLHEHIHLENNILFPKAIQLEKELFNK